MLGFNRVTKVCSHDLRSELKMGGKEGNVARTTEPAKTDASLVPRTYTVGALTPKAVP